MSYNEIIQKAGKEIEPLVYYFDEEGNKQEIDRDNFIRAKIFFNTEIVGTIMRGIELELYNQLPNTGIYFEITAKFGTESDKKLYGPYYLQKTPTFNADKKSYTHDLYDEMITTMVDYEPLSVEFPISILDYFKALCEKCGFITNITSLPNGARQIESDIYQGIGYTIRDIFHDIGQATATLFQIEGGEVKKLLFGTEENIIDDDILKNTNIEMGQHYGPINTIVLARAGDSDKIYYPTILPEDVKEYKISDNQLMAGNNRDEFIAEIYDALNGIEFDVFDCELTGFGGFEPLAKVKIQTDGKEFNSYVFNNEQVITQGYEEVIYSDLPGETQTDFKAADTTDKRINEAYILVQKQNQKIQAVTTKVEVQEAEIKENYYTKVTTNELVQEAVEGLINKYSLAGGNNYIKDSMGALNDGSWDNIASITDTFTRENAVGQTAIMLNKSVIEIENLITNDDIQANYNVIVENGVARQIQGDTNNNPNWKVMQYNAAGQHFNAVVGRPVGNKVSFTFEATSETALITFGINGTVIDTLVSIDFTDFEPGQYTISAEILNSEQGSYSWHNMKLCKGDTTEKYNQIQKINCKNGTYTLSFNYYKIIELASCKIIVNGVEYDLNEYDTLTDFVQILNITTGEVNIEFRSDTNNSCYILDLMLNDGEEPLTWSQNANETITDTVKIGKGIQVESSVANTIWRADADGSRVLNKTTGEVVREDTARGTVTNEFESKGTSNINGMLVLKVGSQVWLNGV